MAEQSDQQWRKRSQGRQHAANTGQQNHGSQGDHGSMGQRGVTRPMHEMPIDGESMEMSPEHRMETLKTHHRQTFWIYSTLILLDFWVAFFAVHLWVRKSSGRAEWRP